MKRNSSRSAPKVDANGLPLECARCGARIVQPNFGRSRKFCSDTCRIAAHRAGRRAEAARTALVTWLCESCGATLRYDRARRTKKVPAACPVCGSARWVLGTQATFAMPARAGDNPKARS